jgi:hypothetical protein
MISKLLGQARNGPRSFLFYTIATSYGKMITRLDYRSSNTFRDALLKVPPTFAFSKDFNYQASTTALDNDRNFLFELSKIGSHLRTPITALTSRGPGDIYTKETCIAFHHLLCELLQLFSDQLRDLPNCQRLKSMTDTYEKIEFVAQLGTVLRLMVRGAAIQKHLQVIEDFLPSRATVLRQGHVDGDEADEPLMQHICQPPASETPKWKSCNN